MLLVCPQLPRTVLDQVGSYARYEKDGVLKALHLTGAAWAESLYARDLNPARLDHAAIAAFRQLLSGGIDTTLFVKRYRNEELRRMPEIKELVMRQASKFADSK